MQDYTKLCKRTQHEVIRSAAAQDPGALSTSGTGCVRAASPCCSGASHSWSQRVCHPTTLQSICAFEHQLPLHADLGALRCRGGLMASAQSLKILRELQSRPENKVRKHTLSLHAV